MFKTAVMEARNGPWGLVAGLVSFVLMLTGGYLLV